MNVIGKMRLRQPDSLLQPSEAVRSFVGEEVARYALRKSTTVPVVQELEALDYERSKKLQDCGCRVTIAHWLNHQRALIKDANFCNMPRLCRFCAHARGVHLARSSALKASEILKGNSDLRPWLVTLTVKNGSDLSERLNHLIKSFKDGWKQRENWARGRRKWSAFCSPAGVIWSVEIKRGGNSGEWHPHMHALWLVRRDRWEWHEGQAGYQLDPFSHRELCDGWFDVTGDSYICNAKPLRSALDLDHGVDVEPAALMCELFEVFKYLTKPSDTTPADVVESWRISQGMKLVRSYGVFRGLKLNEDAAGTVLDGDCWERLFRWQGDHYRESGEWKFVPGREPGDEQN
jgi:hypothetical protein